MGQAVDDQKRIIWKWQNFSRACMFFVHCHVFKTTQGLGHISASPNYIVPTSVQGLRPLATAFPEESLICAGKKLFSKTSASFLIFKETTGRRLNAQNRFLLRKTPRRIFDKEVSERASPL